VGNGGSGKTWLANRIAELTGLPLYHLDKQLWLPGWKMCDQASFVAWQQSVMDGASWIIEGEHDPTTSLRFCAADLVIVMDMNRLVCLARVLRRAGKPREDIPSYLAEPKAFSKGFFHYAGRIWRYPLSGRQTVLSLCAQYPQKAFAHVTSKRQVARLLRQWQGAATTA